MAATVGSVRRSSSRLRKRGNEMRKPPKKKKGHDDGGFRAVMNPEILTRTLEHISGVWAGRMSRFSACAPIRILPGPAKGPPHGDPPRPTRPCADSENNTVLCTVFVINSHCVTSFGLLFFRRPSSHYVLVLCIDRNIYTQHVHVHVHVNGRHGRHVRHGPYVHGRRRARSFLSSEDVLGSGRKCYWSCCPRQLLQLVSGSSEVGVDHSERG